MTPWIFLYEKATVKYSIIAMQCHSGTISTKALAVLNSSIAGHYERARCLYIQDKRNRSVYVEKISKFANYSKNYYICSRIANRIVITMNIEFEDVSLEELYVSGTTTDIRYRKLAKDVVKQYVKVVNYIRAARRIEDLYYIKSLHYEKKKGDLNGVDAVWINRQYRLLFNSSPDEEGIVVNALLFEISKHYE